MNDIRSLSCPICSNGRVRYARTVGRSRIIACNDCNFLFADLQQIDRDPSTAENTRCLPPHGDQPVQPSGSDLRRRAACHYFDLIKEYGVNQGELLEIGCGDGDRILEAISRGFVVTSLEFSDCAVAAARIIVPAATIVRGELDDLNVSEAKFDVCIVANVVEHVRDPRRLLDFVWKQLKPGGCLFIATPKIDPWSTHLTRGPYLEFKRERLSYFSRKSLESLLWQLGFSHTRFETGVKPASLFSVGAYFSKSTLPASEKITNFEAAVLPAQSFRESVDSRGGEMLALGTKSLRRANALVSIIVPVYNEANTVHTLLTLLLQKVVIGAQLEIIVVESNSTDGSREIVQAFEKTANFKLFYENAPHGKGAATRLGIENASGDIILIQDADLEYDLEDYDYLLEPILNGREPFVLGARHGGAFWKMRQFEGAYGTSLLMNLAHWVFTTMINLMFSLRLRDPFTMYKVFRRDAISGIQFKCSRFDFDWELLIQLVRKGYTPLEIPVNYRSRSYTEGKKVRFFWDPITWMLALVRLKFGPKPGKPTRNISSSTN